MLTYRRYYYDRTVADARTVLFHDDNRFSKAASLSKHGVQVRSSKGYSVSAPGSAKAYVGRFLIARRTAKSIFAPVL